MVYSDRCAIAADAESVTVTLGDNIRPLVTLLCGEVVSGMQMA